MKHAGPTTLDQLEPVLARLRALPGLQEKSRGVFYRRGKAFLHFHDDPTGIYADLRAPSGDFDRIQLDAATTETLLAEVAARTGPIRPF